MKKQNGIRAVLWTVLMLAAVLTGCCADGEDACTLDPADPARFTCGGVEYITLREAVPRDAVGRKLGDIQTLAAVDGEGRVVDTCGVTLSFSALARLEERLPEGGRTVQVLNVWALPGTTDGAVAVMVLCQAVSLGMMNGAMSVYFSDLIAEPASMIAAVATIIAMILGYIRGQMKS